LGEDRYLVRPLLLPFAFPVSFVPINPLPPQT
jgi:hypothetical protein